VYSPNSVIPEDGVLCVEENCPRVATKDRFVERLENGLLIVELVCDKHLVSTQEAIVQ
jgi:hypothetical protein